MFEQDTNNICVVYGLKNKVTNEYLKDAKTTLPKIFKKKKKADKATLVLDFQYEVVVISFSEQSNKCLKAEPLSNDDKETVNLIAEQLNKDTNEVYKLSISTTGPQCRVLRHTPLGQKPVREPGDYYQDVSVEIKYRINY